MHSSGERGITRKIDEIDAKIIKGLLFNARKNFVDLAAECNISAVSIGDRFAELEKAGVITGSTIQLDHCALGANATCGVIVKVDKKDTESVVAYIRKIPFEIPLIIYGGIRTDIYFFTSLKDINDVVHLKEIIRRNNSILSLRTEIWTGIRNIPENVEITDTTQSPKQHRQIYTPPVHRGVGIELDAADFQIIEKLSKNSMQPFGQIAKEVGTSIKTVSRKYRRLLDNGVIKPIIQVDLLKLGYHAIVTFALAIDTQSDIESVLQEAMTIDGIVLLIKTSGEFDLFIYVLLKDIDQLLSTQDKVAKIPGVSHSELSVFPVWVPWPSASEGISTF
ncbi:MAG: Lrp/AsnC family transcriptional regulator [Candidatus Bathyarchaeia archaeon]